MSTLTVRLLDRFGNTITEDTLGNAREAKARAKYFLSDVYARRCETTHTALDTHKVEIILNNQVEWDAFI